LRFWRPGFIAAAEVMALHGFGFDTRIRARCSVAVAAALSWLGASVGMRSTIRFVVAAILLVAADAAVAFDQNHTAWDALLKRHVIVAQDGRSSRIDYAGFHNDQSALQVYLDGLSSVAQTEYRAWTRERQLAFLINAYNAFTVELVLTRYPDLKSIKDLGSLLKSPWKKEFFTLLGARRSLDDLEHGLIRAPGAFNEPRIHFALNCAAIGCPMLRDEAYVAERLDSQLEDSVRRFLADRSRNRYNSSTTALEVSRIFDWYKADFENGNRGAGSVPRFLARYSDLLADAAAARALVREGRVQVRYLDYDWTLNDSKR
jgi:hypothetical protein